jgi:hypothetical protein
MKFVLALLLGTMCASNIALAQYNMRVGKQSFAHATVGTTAQLAIASGSVGNGPLHFSVCHDAASASTFLAVGLAADPLTDGQRLAPGQCYACVYCSEKVLKALRVVGQAAGTGYSVNQQLP